MMHDKMNVTSISQHKNSKEIEATNNK